MALRISATNVVNDDRSFVLGSATPASPAVGMIRYNNTLEEFQVYDGVIWKPFIDLVPGETLFSWGTNGYGQLGDETTIARSSPASVVGGFTDWVQASAGGFHSLGIRANGIAYAWGDNILGALGDGTTITKSSPVSVVGGFTDWVQVECGIFSSAGIRANGTAWAWGAAIATVGQNTFGWLGDGTTIDRSSPVSVVGGFTDWNSISVGAFHSLATRANGTAWAWGAAQAGQLGDGTTITKSSPVSVVGGFTDWVQVSASSSIDAHSVALRANGTAWAWGAGADGQLGNGTTIPRSSPVSVVGGFTDWVQVSAGGTSSGALRANGTAWTWGRGTSGQLGDGTTITKSSPVSVVGGFTDWVQINVGSGHVIALRANGTAWTWGSAGGGQGGDGTTIPRSSPVSVVGGFTNWVQVSGNNGFSLAIKA